MLKETDSLLAYPSRTAVPNGRVEEVPPRSKFHIVWAKAVACEADVNPTAPVAPPKLIVIILPLA